MTPRERKKISDRLKALRDSREMTNAEFAEFLGVTPRALASYLYGKTPIAGCVIKLLEHAEKGRI